MSLLHDIGIGAMPLPNLWRFLRTWLQGSKKLQELGLVQPRIVASVHPGRSDHPVCVRLQQGGMNVRLPAHRRGVSQPFRNRLDDRDYPLFGLAARRAIELA